MGCSFFATHIVFLICNLHSKYAFNLLSPVEQMRIQDALLCLLTSSCVASFYDLDIISDYLAVSWRV